MGLEARHYVPTGGESREDFTKGTVDDYKKDYPHATVMVVNVGYALSGKPFLYRTNVSWSNPQAGASDVTFDVIAFSKGTTFVRQGDGGFENVSRT